MSQAIFWPCPVCGYDDNLWRKGRPLAPGDEIICDKCTRVFVVAILGGRLCLVPYRDAIAAMDRR